MTLLLSIKNFLKALLGLKDAIKDIQQQLAGWIPDMIDPRDRVFSLAEAAPSADLRSKFGPVESQGSLNSCVGHAVTSALEAVTGVSDRSRLFVYWNARAYEGRTGSDAGCQIRNGVKGVSVFGASDESTWVYDASKVLVKPVPAAFTAGLFTKPMVLSYARVIDLAGLKAALTKGLPVIFGFSVPQAFRSITAANDVLAYPAAGTAFIGGHAVVAVGFDDATGMVLVRNSFGSTWGSNGYYRMPYAWFTTMSSGLVADAWVITPKA
jgi:C1A family cysteine protease